MKRMYIQPIIETTIVNTHEIMNLSTGSGDNNTSSLGGPVVGNAPKRRTDVF